VRQVHHTCNEAVRIAAPSPKTSNRTAAIKANSTVVPADEEACGRDVLKGIPAVGAVLKYTAVEAEVGVLCRRFKVEVVPERQLRDVPFEDTEIYRVEPLVADYPWIIDERGIWRCISRRHWHPGI
jgi:hypothetical protein